MENCVGLNVHSRRDRGQSLSPKRSNHRRIQTIICAVFVTLCTTPAHACVGEEITAALKQTLPEKPFITIDVEERASVEGGHFEIYKNQAGIVQTILRTDFGESFRSELRLYILSNKTFGFKDTRFEYSVPFYQEGSTVVREIIDVYEVCNGKLDVPHLKDATIDPAEYRKQASEIFSLFGQDQQLNAIILPLKLKPPPWQ